MHGTTFLRIYVRTISKPQIAIYQLWMFFFFLGGVGVGGASLPKFWASGLCVKHSGRVRACLRIHLSTKVMELDIVVRIGCNVPPPRGRARLHLAAFLGHSQPSQTNTSLFWQFVLTRAHPGRTSQSTPIPKFLPLNFSRPSTLNFRVVWRWASGIKPCAGCYILTPLRD